MLRFKFMFCELRGNNTIFCRFSYEFIEKIKNLLSYKELVTCKKLLPENLYNVGT